MEINTNETNDADIAADFARFLEEFSYGSVNEQATAKLREVVAACRKTGNKGSITIKLSIAVKGEMAEVGFSIKTSKPEDALPGRIYFATDNGALATSDPRQLKLPHKILDAQHNNIRTINGDAK